jgi:hypothetical protein
LSLGPLRLRQRLSPGALLRGLLAARGSIQTPLAAEWRPALEAIVQTRRRTALLMNDAAALQIQICVAAARRLPGVMAEAGVLTGGSARLICEAKGRTPLHLFDVFETLQDDHSADADTEPNPDLEAVHAHFGAVHGQRLEVERLLASYPGVLLHPGLFPRSALGLEALTFSFVHLDLDLPTGTRAGLEFFHPRLSPGGMLLGDDHDDPGVRQVFADYFAARPDTVIDLPWGQVLVVKQGAG